MGKLVHAATLATAWILASQSGLAKTNINLLGPLRFVRTSGEPTLTDTPFIALPGKGKITISNGDSAGNNRISSAIVKINSTVIFSPAALNQQVGPLSTTVDLLSDNILSLDLASSPGGLITITITQEADAEAGAAVTTAGGVVEVTNVASLLNGLVLSVPPGALSRPSIITVGLAPSMPVPFPSDANLFGSPFVLNSTSQLLDTVVVDIPFSVPVGDLGLLFHYNEQSGTWRPCRQLPWTTMASFVSCSVISRYSR